MKRVQARLAQEGMGCFGECVIRCVGVRFRVSGRSEE